jgi:hypothetical protein
MRKNQTMRVLEYMQQEGSITSWEARKEIGCTRLSDKIYKL